MLASDSIIHSMFLIFTGAAVVATLALYARQALPVGYIVLGLCLGPWGFGMVSDPALIADVANIGIIFLLFLLGLNLEPGDLRRVFKEAVLVTALTCLTFGALGVAIGALFDYSLLECLLIGAAMMFSSTIIGLKLLPTTALHHQRMGEIIVSILLLQDIVAVFILLLLQGAGDPDNTVAHMALLVVTLPLLVAVIYLIAKHVLMRLFMRFDQIREYVFLLTIGWCLGVAETAELLGLSREIGAFIAGVALATNPIARFIAESLKPLRDFFLIMFFFALGASFDMRTLPDVALATVVFAGAAILIKPYLFKVLLRREHETERLAGEIGVRLGQISEFSLLIAIVAANSQLIGANAASLIKAATMVTFIASSYWIVLRYPTPIALDAKLRRD